MTTCRPPDRPQERAALPAARIACVYANNHCPDLVVSSMSYLRFLRMSEALARRGHTVDVILNRRREPTALGPRLREIPFRMVRWSEYDAIKTFFHRGFETLLAEGGGDHQFIVSKLGSVVGREQTPGVHFFGPVRERLFEIQEQIARRSRRVTVLTTSSAALWEREHGAHPPLLRVPTGVDAELPPPGADPYRALGVTEPVALFAGNLYTKQHQPEVNRLWQERLNRVGRLLRAQGMRLVAMGSGEVSELDPGAVTHVGAIEARRFWDWQRHARVGLVLAQGPAQDNESSKIYYYLRTALPVVCERPVPNAWLVERTGHGALVDYGDDGILAAAALRLAAQPPPPNGIERYMVRDHSWDARAALYDEVMAEAVAARAEQRG